MDGRGIKGGVQHKWEEFVAFNNPPALHCCGGCLPSPLLEFHPCPTGTPTGKNMTFFMTSHCSCPFETAFMPAILLLRPAALPTRGASSLTFSPLQDFARVSGHCPVEGHFVDLGFCCCKCYISPLHASVLWGLQGGMTFCRVMQPDHTPKSIESFKNKQDLRAPLCSAGKLGLPPVTQRCVWKSRSSTWLE